MFKKKVNKVDDRDWDDLDCFEKLQKKMEEVDVKILLKIAETEDPDRWVGALVKIGLSMLTEEERAEVKRVYREAL